MTDYILLKQGELVLKGLNKHRFEQQLLKNIRYRLKPIGQCKVYARQSIVYVEPADDETDMDEVFEALQTVFGIKTMTRAAACEKDKDAIVALAKEYLAEEFHRAASFKVESKRGDKNFPMSSIQLSQYVGGELADAFPDCKVDVHNPEVMIHVEIRESINFYCKEIEGPMGMPVGTAGKAMLLLSGGIDSPVAGYMIAKRGVQLEATYFHAPPYTSERAKQKVVDLAKYVAKYAGPIKLHIVNFTDIQLAIYEKCPHEELTIIMRRYMMMIAEHFALQDDCLGLITGESIGQVASQTMQSLLTTNEVCTLPVYRPLIGFDKQEIIRVSEKIDTYETSIQPYEDCCTIFVAKHPVTKPKLDRIKKSEKRLEDDIDRLLEEAYNSTEVIIVKGDD